MAKLMGIALVAGRRSMTKKRKTVRIGANAVIICMDVMGITFSFYLTLIITKSLLNISHILGLTDENMIRSVIYLHTILITGAGTGLGKALALAYAKQGHTIILTGRRITPLQEVKKQIESEQGQAYAYQLDIADISNVRETVAEIVNKHSVSYLLNNAGAGCFGPLTELSYEEIDQAVQTNVLGTIYLTKELLPYLLDVSNAKIMNIISTAGQKGKVNESVYVASKFAVRGFTESLQKELEGNVQVTATYMGGMDTPFWDETDHIKDKSRLKSAAEVAEIIMEQDNEMEIHV
jgi:short-subunit dehydrogenase